MISFLIGLLAGGFLGVAIMAILSIGRESDSAIGENKSNESPHFPKYRLYVLKGKNDRDYYLLDLRDGCEQSIQRFADDTNIQLVFKPFEINEKESDK